MGSQHQNESKSSPKEGQKSGQPAQPRSDDHTNSARAGENLNRPADNTDQGAHKPQHGQQSRPDK